MNVNYKLPIAAPCWTLWYPSGDIVDQYQTKEEASQLFENNKIELVEILLDEMTPRNKGCGYEKYALDFSTSTKDKIVVILNYDLNYIKANLELIRQCIDLNSLYLGILREFWRWNNFDWCYRSEFYMDNNYVLLSYLNPNFDNMYGLHQLSKINKIYDLSDDWFKYAISMHLDESDVVKHWPFQHVKSIIEKFIEIDFPLDNAKILFAEYERYYKGDKSNKFEYDEFIRICIDEKIPRNRKKVYRSKRDDYKLHSRRIKWGNELKIKTTPSNSKEKDEEYVDVENNIDETNTDEYIIEKNEKLRLFKNDYYKKIDNLFKCDKIDAYIDKFLSYLNLFRFCTTQIYVSFENKHLITYYVDVDNTNNEFYINVKEEREQEKLEREYELIELTRIEAEKKRKLEQKNKRVELATKKIKPIYNMFLNINSEIDTETEIDVY